MRGDAVWLWARAPTNAAAVASPACFRKTRREEKNENWGAEGESVLTPMT